MVVVKIRFSLVLRFLELISASFAEDLFLETLLMHQQNIERIPIEVFEFKSYSRVYLKNPLRR